MVREYTSPEYFAQELKKCIKAEGNYPHRAGVTGWRTEQHGDRVDIWVTNKRYAIIFKEGAEIPLASLESVEEVRTDKGATNELRYVHLSKLKLSINRAASGRISHSSLTDFLENEVLGRIKKDLKDK